MRRSIFWISVVSVVFASSFLFSRFLSENSVPTQLTFFIWRTKEVGLGVLVSLSFFAGFLLSSFICVSSITSKMLDARRLRRENEALQKMMESRESVPEPHSSSSK